MNNHNNDSLERQATKRTKPICKHQWQQVDVIQSNIGYQLALECGYCGERQEELVDRLEEVN